MKIYFMLVLIMALADATVRAQAGPGQAAQERQATIQDALDQAADFSASYNDVIQALDALNKLQLRNKAFFLQYHIPTLSGDLLRDFDNKYHIPEITDDISQLIDALHAVYLDLNKAIQTNDYGILLNGEIVNQVAMKMIDKMSGDLTELFRGSSKLGDLGLGDLLKAGLYAENHQWLEAVTHLVDAVNEFAWGSVGWIIGGPEESKLFQQVAGAAADYFRAKTEKLFEDVALSNSGLQQTMVNKYYQAQRQRLLQGELPFFLIKRFDGDKNGMYSQAEAEQAGITAAKANQAYQNIINEKQNMQRMKHDFNMNTVIQAKNGSFKLNGVSISVKEDYARATKNLFADKVIRQRPKNKPLYYDLH